MSIRRTRVRNAVTDPFFSEFNPVHVRHDTDSRIFESNVADVVTRDE